MQAKEPQEEKGTTTVAKPRLKRKAGLAEVYQAAGLPTVTSSEELLAGEQRMLSERELQEFVTELYQPMVGAGQQRAAGESGGKKGRSASWRK